MIGQVLSERRLRTFRRIALLIAFQRHIAVCDREIKFGNYAPVRERFWREGIREVRGTALGILGMGAIGREVAGIANVLGATVSYCDTGGSPPRPRPP